MDVIGLFTTRDVFVVAQSVLTSELTESVNFVNESETRDDIPGRVDFPSWKLTLHCYSSEDWPTLSMRNARRRTANLLSLK